MDTTIFTGIFSATLEIFFLAVFLTIIVKILTNTIDLGKLISEQNGKASLSRFQLLVFTLVIGGLYLVLSIESGHLIDVPGGALALLGISGGSFVVSKGIGGNAKP